MSERRARLPATVIALGVTSFFTDVASEAVFPLLPGFLALLGAGPTFLGLLEGVADAVSAGLKYQSGRWADRGAKKGFVLAGYGIATLVRPLLALATLPWHVFAIRVTDRVGKGIRSAPRDALIAGAVPSAESGRAFGFHQAMDHAGAVVGPLLATGLLLLGVEVRTVFALTLIPGLLAVASVFVVKEPETVVPSAEERARNDATPLPPKLRSLFVIIGFFALGNSSDAFLLLRAAELGVSTPLLPMAWLLLNLSKMFWASRGGDWSDRQTRGAGTARHRLILAGWAVYAVSYGLFAVATQAWQAWALLGFYGAFAGLTEPVEKALVKDLTPKEQHGRAFGVYHGVLGATAIPSGLLTGFLWQQFGPATALGVGAAVAAISAVWLVRWSGRG
ncbi:MAG: MFS transporter [Archangium sp.]|nr:MFS transporter [Archangium sp.]